MRTFFELVLGYSLLFFVILVLMGAAIEYMPSSPRKRRYSDIYFYCLYGNAAVLILTGLVAFLYLIF